MWWNQHAAALAASCELAIQYLYIEACGENVVANIDSIGLLLTDRELFRHSQLSYELGQLMNAAYPFLSVNIMKSSQNLLLGLYDDDRNLTNSDWIDRGICRWLQWIPACFRLSDSQERLDYFCDYLHPFDRNPPIQTSGGWIAAPFSAEALLGFSPDGIIRLLQHYEPGSSGEGDDWNLGIGGTTEVLREFENAVALDPQRFVQLLPKILDALPNPRFIVSIITGLANHIRYRSGRLQLSQQWKPLSTPDPLMLAQLTLSLLEDLPNADRTGRIVVDAMLACAETLTDLIDAERLTFLLFEIARIGEPASFSDHNLITVAMNSVVGRAAEAAYTLYNRLLETASPVPEFLPALLHRFACDANEPVRAMVLNELTYTLTKAPAIGWHLFQVALSPPTNLWAYAERCLYYQYYRHYGQVAPWLEMWDQEGPENAAAAWARITALACLAGHMPIEALLDKLSQKNSIEAWKGAGQVFVANIGKPDLRQNCRLGILELLKIVPSTKEMVDLLERVFLAQDNYPSIDHELARKYLGSLSNPSIRCDLHEFLGWLAYAAQDNPKAALETAETMLDILDKRKEPPQIWSKEELLSALTAILREADESDDADLIGRAIKLQDRLLMLDIHGMHELYEELAGKA
jgi:hypothetical protein